MAAITGNQMSVYIAKKITQKKKFTRKIKRKITKKEKFTNKKMYTK